MDAPSLTALVARVNARAMEHDIYGSLYLKAGALLQTLAKLPCLEHSKERFAWHATEAYLILNARALNHPPKAAVALLRDAASGALGVARIARRLRDWTVA
ncbi:fic family toxin-antitoxin system, toxin component [Streptomyces prasinus]|uniref:fic family toxin-antitoxin system, toxin component n=1 Tax=Streptomyces prasinus TaxID=67345 RepID=UPI003D9F71D7